jgi:hypothetical protein
MARLRGTILPIDFAALLTIMKEGAGEKGEEP